MILRSFPGTDYQAPETQRILSLFGQETIIIHALTDQIAFSQHTAPLSIKTTFQGCELYEINGHPVVVDQDSYLVVNDEQPYASSIESTEIVESFCVFFRDDLAQEVLSVFRHQADWLVDHPDNTHLPHPEPFFQHRRQADALISPVLSGLRHKVQTNDLPQSWLDEQYHCLIERLLWQHTQIQQEIEKLPMVRRATRLELFKRLYRARDFIEACYAEPISLTDIAGAGCLSRHHFLRLFAEVFHQTPHQYLTTVRLHHARQLLATRCHTVTDVCFAVGFENTSSFARLFKRHFGCSPHTVSSLA
ncbi:MAG: helix-turn-helix transcriptional regulator [Acidobacteria bacterium]|nr:helix-turn-helix transcriptional regulator [Acidobacteriota bacterium]